MISSRKKEGLKNFGLADQNRHRMRQPGFEPGLPDWQSDVLDQTGRPSQRYRNMINWDGYIMILLLGEARFRQMISTT